MDGIVFATYTILGLVASQWIGTSARSDINFLKEERACGGTDMSQISERRSANCLSRAQPDSAPAHRHAVASSPIGDGFIKVA